MWCTLHCTEHGHAHSPTSASSAELRASTTSGRDRRSLPQPPKEIPAESPCVESAAANKMTRKARFRIVARLSLADRCRVDDARCVEEELGRQIRGHGRWVSKSVRKRGTNCSKARYAEYPAPHRLDVVVSPNAQHALAGCLRAVRDDAHLLSGGGCNRETSAFVRSRHFAR